MPRSKQAPEEPAEAENPVDDARASGRDALPPEGFVRLQSFLGRGKAVPIGPTRWWEGVGKGEFPKPIKVGRMSLWRVEDIRDLIKRLSEQAAVVLVAVSAGAGLLGSLVDIAAALVA